MEWQHISQHCYSAPFMITEKFKLLLHHHFFIYIIHSVINIKIYKCLKKVKHINNYQHESAANE